MESSQNHNLSRKEIIEMRRQERRENVVKPRKTRRILIWLIVVLLIGGGIYGAFLLAKNNSVSGTSGNLFAAVSASDWFKGTQNAKVVLVEYSDFQCPACALFNPVVEKLISDNPGKIELVYRNFPLPMHLNARNAAYAAEAAGKQGKYWEMHDLIFSNQTAWENSTTAKDIFAGYADQLKINVDQFKNDFDSKEIKDKVEADYQSGIKSGVDSTPTFFLNGKKMSVPNSFDEFRNTIQQSVDSSK